MEFKVKETLEILKTYFPMEICWKILSGIVKPHDAIKQGCTEVFLYEEMYENFPNKCLSISSLWDSAAEHGNLRILQELKAHNVIANFDWSLCYAAYHGNWDCFLWLIENGKPIGEETMNWAAAGGQLEIIQWLHEKGYTCSERAMENAIRNQHQKVIEWLFVHGFPCSSNAVDEAIRLNDERNMRKLIEEKGLKCTRSGTYYAAKKGDLDLVAYLYKKEMPFGSDAFNTAAAMKHIHILDFLYQNGIKGTTEAMDHCAKNGDMKTIQWLHIHEYTCSKNATTYATEKGSMEVLQWLIEHGKPVNVDSCMKSAGYMGYTHILEYLYDWIEIEEEDNKDSWVKTAIVGGHLTSVKFFHETCQISPSFEHMSFAIQKGTNEIILYYEDVFASYLKKAMSGYRVGKEDIDERITKKYIS